jgi:hypothetical protein
MKSLFYWYNTNVGTKVISLYFFSKITITTFQSHLHIYCAWVLHTLRLFSHRVSSIINTSFLHLPETLCARRLNLSSEMSELFTHAMFKLVVFSKTASSDWKLLGSKKMGRQKALNFDCRQDEGEASTAPPLQLCPLCTDWCAVWLFHVRGLDSSSCLSEPFCIRCFECGRRPRSAHQHSLSSLSSLPWPATNISFIVQNDGHSIQLWQLLWHLHHVRFSDNESLSEWNLPQ